ncbi:MAG: hypothetical protein J3R72DRAFT_441976 [Linnemannia gamsii]|nr:MAG: hypothetical protein J3R72DRAFT_441976 [Linnemannia gamsii]
MFCATHAHCVCLILYGCFFFPSSSSPPSLFPDLWIKGLANCINITATTFRTPILCGSAYALQNPALSIQLSS